MNESDLDAMSIKGLMLDPVSNVSTACLQYR